MKQSEKCWTDNWQELESIVHFHQKSRRLEVWPVVCIFLLHPSREFCFTICDLLPFFCKFEPWRWIALSVHFCFLNNCCTKSLKICTTFTWIQVWSKNAYQCYEDLLKNPEFKIWKSYINYNTSYRNMCWFSRYSVLLDWTDQYFISPDPLFMISVLIGSTRMTSVFLPLSGVGCCLQGTVWPPCLSGGHAAQT